MDGGYWFYRRLHQKFKNDKEGLKGRFKVIGQVGLELLLTDIFFHSEVTIKEQIPVQDRVAISVEQGTSKNFIQNQNQPKCPFLL